MKKKSYKSDHVQIGESKKRKNVERVSNVSLAQHPYSHFIQKMQLIKSKNSDGNS